MYIKKTSQAQQRVFIWKGMGLKIPSTHKYKPLRWRHLNKDFKSSKMIVVRI